MAQTSYSTANLITIPGARVEILCSKWHQEITRPMISNCVEILSQAGCYVPEPHILPGCLEIPLAARRLAKCQPAPDALVVFGVILKGDTYHFDIVKDLTMSGLERVQFECDIPIINEILPVNSLDDAKARAADDNRNKGLEAALAAVEIIDWFRQHRLETPLSE